MAQQIPSNFPSLSHHEHQERVDAVNYVLADMQQFLPTEIESKTLAAMKDYMVTELSQFQPFDQLLLRNASIKMLIKDATDRLLQLQKQAQDLLTDLNVGGPVRERTLQTKRISWENLTLKARLVEYDAELMNLRTEDQFLKQSLECYKNILQRNVERGEQAREMTETQERGNERQKERTTISELTQECQSIKHNLDRVEAERDCAKRTLRHQNWALQELQIWLREAEEKLQSRLQEIEKLYQASRQSIQGPTNTRPPQKPAAGDGGRPASNGIDTGGKIRSLTPTDSQTTNLNGADLLGSGFGSTSPENLGQRVVEEDKSSENCTEGKTAMKSPSGATSVRNPGSSRVVIPVMPLFPPKPIVYRNPPKEEEQNGDPSQEMVSISLFCIKSSFLLINYEKDNTAPSKAEDES